MNTKKVIKKIGFYKIYKTSNVSNVKYIIDNGKLIYSKRYKKYLPNENWESKEFIDLDKANEYCKNKLKNYNKNKGRITPKSLYLILLKEVETNLLFVKVGVTSKKFIVSRFSKTFGYDGYVVETILRRIDTEMAEDLEQKILDKLKKRKTIKKYRPLLESFSGYSECFNYDSVNEIIQIFDTISKNY